MMHVERDLVEFSVLEDPSAGLLFLLGMTAVSQETRTSAASLLNAVHDLLNFLTPDLRT